MERKTHILVIPYPIPGHINPMLQFSKRLASKGARVTLVTTTSISKSMEALQEGSVYFETIPDGYEEGGNLKIVDARLEHFSLVVAQSLAELIERQNSSQHPPKFLVYDSVMPWALNIARQLGVDGAPFFTQSCAVNAIYHHAHQGSIEMPLKTPSVSLPSMPSLGINDVPSFFNDTASYPALLKVVVNQFSNFQEANWIFCNTYDKLEHEVASAIRSIYMYIYITVRS
jgi:pathogen-inducible salicylic acid glucosyltransferase